MGLPGGLETGQCFPAYGLDFAGIPAAEKVSHGPNSHSMSSYTKLAGYDFQAFPFARFQSNTTWTRRILLFFFWHALIVSCIDLPV